MTQNNDGEDGMHFGRQLKLLLVKNYYIRRRQKVGRQSSDRLID